MDFTVCAVDMVTDKRKYFDAATRALILSARTDIYGSKHHKQHRNTVPERNPKIHSHPGLRLQSNSQKGSGKKANNFLSDYVAHHPKGIWFEIDDLDNILELFAFGGEIAYDIRHLFELLGVKDNVGFLGE